MSYAILDVNNNKVVETTINEFGALDFVKRLNPKAMALPLVTKTELLAESQYRMGNYILVDGMTCELIEKKMVIDPGMVWNGRIPGLQTIGIWKTIPIADNLLKAKNQNQNQDPVRVIDTGFNASNETKIKEVLEKTKPLPGSVYVLPPQPQPLPQPQPSQTYTQPQPQLQPQPAQTYTQPSIIQQIIPAPIVQKPIPAPAPPVAVSIPASPVPVFVPARPIPVQQYQQIATTMKPQQKIPSVTLDQLARNPMIFSIGSGSSGQKEKIGQIIQHQIAIGLLSEENVIIVSNGNTKNTEAWAKCYPQGLVYETLDNDMLQYLIMSLSAPAQQTRRGTFRNVVLFDHCLTRNHINQQFLKFLDTVKNNQIKVMIMTEDKDLIRSDVSKKFDYMFIHSFNYTMSMTYNEIQEFVKKHDFLKAATMVESDMMECFRQKNCIAFDVTQPNKMFQF